MIRKPDYIQIVDCGKFAFALWDYPQTHMFYPVHGTEEECVKWALENQYELATDSGRRTIWRLKE